MGQELEKTKKVSLLAAMAAKSQVDPQIFLNTIKQTVIKGPATNEQITAFLMVANRYELDPILKEIHAFADKKTGGVVPIVGVDGWNTMAQRHPAWDGTEFRWAEKSVVMSGAKACPEWCECIVYRKDRAHPVVIREYLDECYRATGPWQSHTKRMLRHKTMIQAYRVAFGFSGLYDEDEAERIVVEGSPEGMPAPAPSTNAEKARQVLSEPLPPAAPSAPAQSQPDAADEVVDDYIDVEVDEVTGEIIEEEETAGAVGPMVTAPTEEDMPKKADFDAVLEEAKAKLDAVEEPEEKPVARVTKKQLEALAAAKTKGGWTDELFNRMLSEEYGVKTARELDREQALDMIKHLLAGAADSIQEGFDV